MYVQPIFGFGESNVWLLAEAVGCGQEYVVGPQEKEIGRQDLECSDPTGGYIETKRWIYLHDVIRLLELDDHDFRSRAEQG